MYFYIRSIQRSGSCAPSLSRDVPINIAALTAVNPLKFADLPNHVRVSINYDITNTDVVVICKTNDLCDSFVLWSASKTVDSVSEVNQAA